MRPIEYEHPNLSVGRILSYCPSLTGATGTRAYDLSGYDKHGDIIGADLSVFHTRSEGKGAYLFDGVNDKITTNKVMSEIAKTDALTWSCWFNTSSSASNQALVTCEDGVDRYLNIYLWPSFNEIYIGFRRSSGGWALMPTITLNKWHHFALVWNPTNGTGFTYLDGIRGANAPAGPTFAERPFEIGINGPSGGIPLQGMQDDINVYNRPLSAGEIKVLASQRGVANLARRRKTVAPSVSGVSKSEDSVLALVDTATYAVIETGLSRSVSSTLALTQNTNFFILSQAIPVQHTLNLVDTVKVKGREFGSEALTLTQSADFRIGIPSGGYFITDNLNFNESLNRGQNYGVTDNLNLSSVGAHITPTVSSLAFTQTVTLSQGKTVLDTLTFTQSVTSESRFSRSTSHTNILQQAVGFYVVGSGKCSKTKYSRFEGSGGGVGIPTQPLASNHIPVAFESVNGSPAPVFIRAPEMDDKHRMSFDRVNRETLGGELSVFRDTVWPTTKSMLFTVVGIKTTVFESLQSFLLATLGQEVLFHDWTGVTWRGIVTNPEETATEDRDGYWTVAFEFEGSPYDGPPANHSLAFSQTATFTIG
jgi:hypothetical protein